jgi:eukaryotic-like serine/threonine-protein kinase
VTERSSSRKLPRVIGRYAIHDRIAAGGMATVHLGKLHGVAGFSPIVAIKCVHSSLATDPEFVNMLLDEARLAARVRHPNVVPVLDLVQGENELFMVMEYVHGEALSRLVRATSERSDRIPPAIATSIACGMLHGLHAAHEAKSETDEPLGIVHRDISPQNVIVGVDGVPRVLDFGVAKATGRSQTTREGQVKGKLAYMAPEQLRGQAVSRQADLYAAAVVLWEVLAGRRLFAGDNEGSVVEQVLFAEVAPPSQFAQGVPPALDAVVLRGLARDCNERFRSAREMARAVEDAVSPAAPHKVGEWVERVADETLSERQRMLREIDRSPPMSDVAVHATPDVGATSLFEPALVASQISNITVSTFAETVRRPKRRALQIATIALAAAAIGTAVGASLRGSAKSDNRVERAASEPIRPLASPEPAVAEPPPAEPSVSATPSMTLKPTAPRPPKRTSTPGKSNCDPPFVRDDEGRKIYKRECLK